MVKKRKTPQNKRSTYTYVDLLGNETVITTDEEGVTDAMIYDLHKADDREIDNNAKNKHKRLNEQERAEKKKWEAEHPGEKWDLKYTLSIEGLQDSGIAMDKSSLLSTAANNDFEYGDLYEALESLPLEQANLIRKLYLAGYTQKEIAETEGVTPVAVNNRVKKILKKLKKFLSEG